MFAADRSQKKIVLSVIDSGVGIKPAAQQKLFKLFGRIRDTEQINTKGIGLGLAISKMIAEEFGGRVAVSSGLGQGSAFFASFRLSCTSISASNGLQLSELDL